MVPVAIDGFAPLGGVPVDRAITESEGVDDLTPEQKTRPIRPGEEAKILDLSMGPAAG